MALTFIGQSVASAIIGKLVETCSSYLMACPAASSLQDELNQLSNALTKVQAILTAVEEGAPDIVQNKGLDGWLWQLRDTVENAEDVLDELDYYKLEKTIQDRDDKVRGNIPSKCKTKIDSFIFSDDTLKRLREAVKGLDRVVASIGPFLQIATGIYGHNVKRRKLEKVKNARETSCLLTESEVLGRDKERDLIVEWLIKPVDDESEAMTFNVSAYTIVGMGGIGKTTLAQLIYHDKKVREYFNNRIMWVCVSQDFNANVITRKILEAINHGSSDDKHYLNTLHEDLKQKLTSKRFLLILDDVWDNWNDDINYTMEWEKLVAPLKFGQRGSKILLTTRMDTVADIATKVMKCKQKSLVLNALEESDCMSLFNKYAFLGVNPDLYKNLQPTGEQIVKKLGGCPLAIKVMGGLLNSNMDNDYWKKILKEDITKGKDGIMTILKLSYYHLPTNLQVCFRYCSIFPQDYTFKRKSLVYMWMSSGLIPQSNCGEERPEDIGREYLDLLTRYSLFTCKTSDNRLKTSKRYFMHDLLHELAQSVSLGECIRIKDDIAGKIIPYAIRPSVRHLSIELVNLLSIREISNLKNLRTLIISINNDDYNVDHLLVFNEVMEGFKKLRLLSLDVHSNSYKLPTAVSSLIHLRYLSLSQRAVTNESFIDFFRSSLCRLYHLQFLKLLTLGITTCNIEYDGLTNLLNLRLLDDRHGMIENIRYVSKLPFIHKLEKFFVQEESGYKIGELKNLRDLRHLCIGRLENVSSSEEAMEAKLDEKEYLKSLSLKWSEGRSNSAEADERLLDKLCPHIKLKRLRIQNYEGVKSPCWMTDPSLVNLTSIELIDCKGWEHLPPLGGLPLLNRLYLCELHEVKQIDRSFYGSSGVPAFPSLKDLIFKDLPNLEEWIGIDDGCMFPRLHCMEIIDCPNLGGIPTLRCSIKRMKISYVGLTALPTINLDCGNNNQQEHCKALESLIIKQCEKLQDVPPEYFQKFNSLKFLCIEKCPKLTTRGILDIQLPSTLNELTIGSCGDLEVPLLSSVNLTSLTELNLIDCAMITSFPPEQVCAWRTMLSHLTIKDCKELPSFGGIQDFESLRSLEITGCDKLIEVAMSPNDVSQENAIDCCLKLGELSIDHHALLLMKPLRSLTSISSLTLSDASRLTSLPEEWILQNHNALKCLSIWNAISLQSLPQSMTKLCFLQDLRVHNANLIQSLPDLPTSLQTLYITGCHPVLKERCQKNIGLYWPKIAEIPDVMIA